MANGIDFTKKKKAYFNVVLDDGNDTKLRVMTPSKKLSEELDALFSEAFTAMPVQDQYETLYDAATAILNRNADGKHIKREDVEDCLDDIVDVWTLVNAYRMFTFEQMQAQAKN